MKKKTDAALRAIGIFLGANALLYATPFIARLVYGSSFAKWLEIKPTKPYVPGSLFALTILMLLLAIFYYQDKVKRG